MDRQKRLLRSPVRRKQLALTKPAYSSGHRQARPNLFRDSVKQDKLPANRPSDNVVDIAFLDTSCCVDMHGFSDAFCGLSAR
jgi:hypothetical protein